MFVGDGETAAVSSRYHSIGCGMLLPLSAIPCALS